MKNVFFEIPTDLRGSLFLLGSQLASYPDDSFGEYWKRSSLDYDLLQGAEMVHPEIWKECLVQLRNKLEVTNGLDDWRSEYVSVFDTGRESNPIYETEYGKARAMAKGAQLADIAGFYKAFGFEIDDKKNFREILDHLAVELEFYGLLLLKEHHLQEIEDQLGVKVVRDAQAKFLKDHLGTFVDALKLRPGVSSSELFYPIVNWITFLVNGEAKRLSVDSKKVFYAGDEKEPELMCCTSTLGGASNPCA